MYWTTGTTEWERIYRLQKEFSVSPLPWKTKMFSSYFVYIVALSVVTCCMAYVVPLEMIASQNGQPNCQRHPSQLGCNPECGWCPADGVSANKAHPELIAPATCRRLSVQEVAGSASLPISCAMERRIVSTVRMRETQVVVSGLINDKVFYTKKLWIYSCRL